MDAEKREEWDAMLPMPLPGEPASAVSPFTAEDEADSFLSAMSSLRGG